jgi:tetratricopeptide (TPR) repeat protein
MKSPRHEALCHFDKGVDHQQCGRLEEAKTSYLLAIKADQFLAAAYNNLGFICMQMGDYVTAAKQFQQVVRLEPHNLEAFHNSREPFDSAINQTPHQTYRGVRRVASRTW